MMSKLTDFNVSDYEIEKTFEYNKNKSGLQKINELNFIFQTCMNDKELFPNFRGTIVDIDEYIKKWIDKYIKARENNIFNRKGNPSSTLPDSIIDVIIKNRINVNDSQIVEMIDAHQLYMYAEQIQGSILEAFLEKKLIPYGWYYCYGEVVKSVDFCHEKGTLLQIKNKYNTENSSSSKVRQGTTIKKWCRLGRPSNNKPTYNWNKLCELVNSLKDNTMEDLSIDEKDYENFVREVLEENPNLFYVNNNNYWDKNVKTNVGIKLKHVDEYWSERDVQGYITLEDENKEYLHQFSSDYIHIPKLKVNVYEYTYWNDYNEEIEDYEYTDGQCLIIVDSETNELIDEIYYDLLEYCKDKFNNYKEEEIENMQCYFLYDKQSQIKNIL